MDSEGASFYAMQMKSKRHRAKKHFPRKSTPKRAEEEISSSSAEVAKVGKTQAECALTKRLIGMDKGSIEIADDFDAPLPPRIFDSSE